MCKENTKSTMAKKKLRKVVRKKLSGKKRVSEKMRKKVGGSVKRKKYANDSLLPTTVTEAKEWSMERIGIGGSGVVNKTESGKAPKSFIDRNFNMRLVYFLGFCVLLLFLITLLYNSLFQNIGEKYDSKVEAIETLSGELNASIGELNATASELEVREAREEELSEQYVSVRADKEQLKVDLDSMTTLKEGLDVDLAETEAELDAEVALNTQLNAQVSELQSQVNWYSNQYSVCKSRLSSLEDQLDACGG
jgi:hypothetical protein